MFGADVPADLWPMTFLHAKLASPPPPFVFPPTGQLFSRCDGAVMFGADAPAHIWQMTFLHAKLASPAPNFVFPTSGQLFSMGDGQTAPKAPKPTPRSEEHTSELQSLRHLVCR